MAKRILAVAFLGCLAGLAPGSALASESNTQCYGQWIAGHYFHKCTSTYEGKYSTTRTVCASGPVDAACRTTSEAKPQPRREPPRPYTPPTTTRDPDTGIRVMRGMSR